MTGCKIYSGQQRNKCLHHIMYSNFVFQMPPATNFKLQALNWLFLLSSVTLTSVICAYTLYLRA